MREERSKSARDVFLRFIPVFVLPAFFRPPPRRRRRRLKYFHCRETERERESERGTLKSAKR